MFDFDKLPEGEDAKQQIEDKINSLNWDETLDALNRGRERRLASAETTEIEAYACLLMARRLRSLREVKGTKTREEKSKAATSKVSSLNDLLI